MDEHSLINPDGMSAADYYAIEELDSIDGQEPDGNHSQADNILLDLVNINVRNAYLRLKNRARWWATA